MFDELKDKSIFPNLDDNIKEIKKICASTSDLLVNRFKCGNVNACLLCCEGMFSTSTLTELILYPLTSVPKDINDAYTLFDYVQNRLLLSADRLETTNYADLFRTLNSGFAILIADGIGLALSFGVQGYEKRSVSEPSSEENIYGSHEGFCEVVRINMSLLRRRLKSPLFHMELFTLGTECKTDVCLCYMRDRVSADFIKQIKQRLRKIKLEVILTSGYVRPFLEDGKPCIFDSVGTSERPDVVCAKLIEGRVALLIDGIPFALTCPKLFSESFQTLDDYCFKPFYAAFIRILKYAAFFISIFLPSIYVAFGVHHPNMLNPILMDILSKGEESAPFPLLIEALGVLLLYEIIKESGLRLPKGVGGTVSIVGGLIIGDAAVKSGLISTPVLTISAISVLSGFVINDFAPQISVLRIVFLICGGLFGLFGIAAAATLVLFNVCSSESFGYPITAPISPFDLYAMRDTFLRFDFKKLQKGNFTIEKLNIGDEPNE